MRLTDPQHTMPQKTKIKEINCKSAIAKCDFPGGGLAINPYVGCAHNCVYCYARFMKRFTGHNESWGSFVDVKVNIAEVLEKQLKSSKYKKSKETIFIGTVTDPYQWVEKEYKLTRKILQLLLDYRGEVSILTKSDLVLRDLDLLKQFRDININFTITTLDEKWKKHIEPNSPTVSKRLLAIKKLVKEGIPCFAMMGPYWPIFTDPEALFKEFKKAGVSQVFTESMNTIGGNWTGVEKVLREYYPKIMPKMQEIMLNKRNFNNFYGEEKKKLKALSKKYRIPITIFFGPGHDKFGK